MMVNCFFCRSGYDGKLFCRSGYDEKLILL